MHYPEALSPESQAIISVYIDERLKDAEQYLKQQEGRDLSAGRVIHGYQVIITHTSGMTSMSVSADRYDEVLTGQDRQKAIKQGRPTGPEPTKVRKFVEGLRQYLKTLDKNEWSVEEQPASWEGHLWNDADYQDKKVPDNLEFRLSPDHQAVLSRRSGDTGNPPDQTDHPGADAI